MRPRCPIAPRRRRRRAPTSRPSPLGSRPSRSCRSARRADLAGSPPRGAGGQGVAWLACTAVICAMFPLVEVNVLIGLGAMALSFVLFWVWALFTRMRLHRLQEPPDAATPTMELREETPAVVSLLTHGLRLDGDALAATVLDLAARDHLEVVELSPAQNLVVPRQRDRSTLKDYERRVLEVVERAAGDQPHATVPAIADALG